MPRLASAPVTWGVWEKTYGRPDLIDPGTMLDQVTDLGFRGIELGPRGYFGDDAEAVRATFAGRDLELVGAFVELALYDEERFRREWAELEWTIPLLGELAGSRRGAVVLADSGSPERQAAAGRPDRLVAIRPAADDTARALERLDEVARRCAAGGVDLAVHHHASTHLETLEEIDALMAGSDPELVGVCIDSGHAHLGGVDPCALLDRCAGRIRLLHLKDVDDRLLARLRDGELDLDAAWAAGLFCELGAGGAGIRRFLEHPEARGFPGWLVLEQDRVHVGPADVEQIAEVERRHLALVDELLAAPQGRPEA
jgi:inosose dehydratase